MPSGERIRIAFTWWVGGLVECAVEMEEEEGGSY